MCCFECRIVLKGSMVVMGFPFEKLPGDTLAAKRKHLSSLDVSQLKSLVEKEGSACRFDTTHVALLPSGWVYLYAFSEQSFGLRWTSCGDTVDNERVTRMLKLSLKEYAVLRAPSSGWSSFSAFMELTP